MSLRLPSRPLLLVGVLLAAVVISLALRRAVPWAPAGPQVPASSTASDGPAAATDPACADEAPEAERAGFEERVVSLVNEERRAAGLPPLKRVEPLTLSARFFAHLMATEDYFGEDHDTYRRRHGRLARVCDWTDRIAAFYPGWNALGENIASRYETPDEAVAAWMGSPAHRAEILGRNHWETGAGYSSGGSEGHYWVQDFGRRRGAFPVVIDGEAPSTRSTRVRVFVYGDWRGIRVRNDDGAFTPWHTFEREFEWTLAATPGARTVTVEVRSEGRSASASDSIRLEDQPM